MSVHVVRTPFYWFGDAWSAPADDCPPLRTCWLHAAVAGDAVKLNEYRWGIETGRFMLAEITTFSDIVKDDYRVCELRITYKHDKP